MKRSPTLRVGARALAVAASAALLGACAADPALAPRETMPGAAAVADRLHLSAPVPLPASPWWAGYHDPELTRWIELGLRDSPICAPPAHAWPARRPTSRRHARRRGRTWVSVPASVSERVSGNGLFPPPLAGMVGTLNDVDLSATFELDIFGRLAARTDAARLEAEAGALDRDLAGVRLAGAIGHAYFELARAQRERRIALEIESSRSHTLDIVRERVRAGLDTQVERRLAEVTVPEVRVEIERADEQIALARHSLAVLAGQAPDAADAVQAQLPADAALAPPPPLPLDLLARRADIAAAQRRVRAALRSVDAAHGDFYPNVSISALIGLDSLTTQRLLEYNSRTWQVGPAVHLPIFDGGSLRAHLRSASADTDAAIDAYNTIVLQAARDVADTAASIAAVQRQRSEQALATANALAAADLAETRYRAGLGNYLAVLAAQSAVLTQQRAQVDLDARAAALDVALALALGGGFRDPEQLAAGAAAPAPAGAGPGTRN